MTAILEYQPGSASSFLREVEKRSGQNLTACYQCRRCAAGCPVSKSTENLTPDRLIRTIVLGDRDLALKNLLVWKCVACYTCGTRCPNSIQTARINETLKQMAKEQHVESLSPKIAAFHQSFMDAAKHLGRVNEIEFMGIYELRNTIRDAKKGDFGGLFNEFLAQMNLGLAMMKKKRMHMAPPEIVKGSSEVRKLFKKAKARKSAI